MLVLQQMQINSRCTYSFLESRLWLLEHVSVCKLSRTVFFFSKNNHYLLVLLNDKFQEESMWNHLMNEANIISYMAELDCEDSNSICGPYMLLPNKLIIKLWGLAYAHFFDTLWSSFCTLISCIRCRIDILRERERGRARLFLSISIQIPLRQKFIS